MHTLRLLVVLGFVLSTIIVFQLDASPHSPTDIKSHTSIAHSPTPSISPTPIDDRVTQSHLPFVYPNAILQKVTTDEVILLSSDHPDNISKWYEKKLQQLDIENRVVTKSSMNNSYTSVISGTVQKYTVNLKIERERDEKMTKITISVKNP